ncbi:MAG: metal-dependent transcriptional regulator [Acidobacteriota bacterium]
MPTSTVEDYLKCIYLEEQRASGLVSMGTVAEALGVASGTVTAMVKTLAQSDLVEYEPYAGVRLSAAGRQLALHVLRRHRLIEVFLVEVMGFDWGEVHEEAEQLEHVVSDRLVARMDEMLGHPSVDPHGDPIPSAEGVVDEGRYADLLSFEEGSTVYIARVRDQSGDFLRLVDRSGLVPGALVRLVGIDPAAETVELELEGGRRVSLGSGAAAKLEARPALEAVQS